MAAPSAAQLQVSMGHVHRNPQLRGFTPARGRGEHGVKFQQSKSLLGSPVDVPERRVTRSSAHKICTRKIYPRIIVISGRNSKVTTAGGDNILEKAMNWIAKVSSDLLNLGSDPAPQRPQTSTDPELVSEVSTSLTQETPTSSYSSPPRLPRFPSNFQKKSPILVPAKKMPHPGSRLKNAVDLEPVFQVKKIAFEDINVPSPIPPRLPSLFAKKSPKDRQGVQGNSSIALVGDNVVDSTQGSSAYTQKADFKTETHFPPNESAVSRSTYAGKVGNMEVDSTFLTQRVEVNALGLDTVGTLVNDTASCGAEEANENSEAATESVVDGITLSVEDQAFIEDVKDNLDQIVYSKIVNIAIEDHPEVEIDAAVHATSSEKQLIEHNDTAISESQLDLAGGAGDADSEVLQQVGKSEVFESDSESSTSLDDPDTPADKGVVAVKIPIITGLDIAQEVVTTDSKSLVTEGKVEVENGVDISSTVVKSFFAPQDQVSSDWVPESTDHPVVPVDEKVSSQVKNVGKSFSVKNSPTVRKGKQKSITIVLKPDVGDSLLSPSHNDQTTLDNLKEIDRSDFSSLVSKVYDDSKPGRKSSFVKKSPIPSRVSEVPLSVANVDMDLSPNLKSPVAKKKTSGQGAVYTRMTSPDQVVNSRRDDVVKRPRNSPFVKKLPVSARRDEAQALTSHPETVSQKSVPYDVKPAQGTQVEAPEQPEISTNRRSSFVRKSPISQKKKRVSASTAHFQVDTQHLPSSVQELGGTEEGSGKESVNQEEIKRPRNGSFVKRSPIPQQKPNDFATVVGNTSQPEGISNDKSPSLDEKGSKAQKLVEVLDQVLKTNSKMQVVEEQGVPKRVQARGAAEEVPIPQVGEQMSAAIADTVAKLNTEKEQQLQGSGQSVDSDFNSRSKETQQEETIVRRRYFSKNVPISASEIRAVGIADKAPTKTQHSRTQSESLEALEQVKKAAFEGNIREGGQKAAKRKFAKRSPIPAHGKQVPASTRHTNGAVVPLEEREVVSAGENNAGSRDIEQVKQEGGDERNTSKNTSVQKVPVSSEAELAVGKLNLSGQATSSISDGLTSAGEDKRTSKRTFMKRSPIPNQKKQVADLTSGTIPNMAQNLASSSLDDITILALDIAESLPQKELKDLFTQDRVEEGLEVDSQVLVSGSKVEVSSELDNEYSTVVELEIMHEHAETEIVVQNQRAPEDLVKMKLTELKNIAKERGLKGYSKLKKSELISLLHDITQQQ